jgi:hypothetical protein
VVNRGRVNAYKNVKRATGTAGSAIAAALSMPHEHAPIRLISPDNTMAETSVVALSATTTLDMNPSDGYTSVRMMLINSASAPYWRDQNFAYMWQMQVSQTIHTKSDAATSAPYTTVASQINGSGTREVAASFLSPNVAGTFGRVGFIGEYQNDQYMYIGRPEVAQGEVISDYITHRLIAAAGFADKSVLNKWHAADINPNPPSATYEPVFLARLVFASASGTTTKQVMLHSTHCTHPIFLQRWGGYNDAPFYAYTLDLDDTIVPVDDRGFRYEWVRVDAYCYATDDFSEAAQSPTNMIGYFCCSAAEVHGVAGGGLAQLQVGILSTCDVNPSQSGGGVDIRVLAPAPESTLMEVTTTNVMYNASRLTATAVLVTNTTPELYKGGTINAARFSSKQKPPFSISNETFKGLPPRDKVQFGLHNGLYSFLNAQTSMEFKDHIAYRGDGAVTFSTAGDGSAARAVPTPVVHIDDLGFVNAMILTYPLSSESVSMPASWAITVDAHYEFLATSQLFRSGIGMIPTDEYRAAQFALAKTKPFFENPLHWRDVVQRVKRAWSTAWPVLRPAAIAGGKAALLSLLE